MAGKESIFVGIKPTEKGRQALDRLKERFSLPELPPSLGVLAGSDSAANDLHMNLNRQWADGKLAEKTKLIVAVAVAAAIGNARAVEFFGDIALAKGRTRSEVLDAVSAAGVCSIFNGYYRFRDQIPAEERPVFEAFRAPFNANSLLKSGLSPFEIEAICVAVSSVNSCDACVSGHLNKARDLGMTNEQADELIRASAAAFGVAKLLASLPETNPSARTSP
jgi:alkyl hydroperoxide reductase subunit D